MIMNVGKGLSWPVWHYCIGEMWEQSPLWRLWLYVTLLCNGEIVGWLRPAGQVWDSHGGCRRSVFPGALQAVPQRSLGTGALRRWAGSEPCISITRIGMSWKRMLLTTQTGIKENQFVNTSLSNTNFVSVDFKVLLHSIFIWCFNFVMGPSRIPVELYLYCVSMTSLFIKYTLTYRFPIFIG
jgi:hypothetical protein